MRPSSLGGGRILRRTLSVRLSVRPVPGSTFVIILADVRYLLLLFTFAAPHTVSAISRTSLFYLQRNIGTHTADTFAAVQIRSSSFATLRQITFPLLPYWSQVI